MANLMLVSLVVSEDLKHPQTQSCVLYSLDQRFPKYWLPPLIGGVQIFSE